MIRPWQLAFSATLLTALLPAALASTSAITPNSAIAQPNATTTDDASVVAMTVRDAPLTGAGLTWTARTGFSNGTYWGGPSGDIMRTTDQELYRPEFRGMRSWTYSVPNGQYRVTLKMREASQKRPGRRVFSVQAEGAQVIKDLDILREAGFRRAYDRFFDVVVNDGRLDLAFSAKRNYAIVSAIKVDSLAATTPTNPPISTGSSPSTLTLPRIPWEGGNQFYKKFPDAVRGGWGDESFFPIAIWWAVFGTDAEVAWDKSLGINTYVVTNPANVSAAPLMEAHGMSWIGGQLPGMTRASKSWVGDFLDDEVDGRYTPEEGLAFLRGLAQGLPDHNKIRYLNYTSSIVNQWFNENAAERYVNEFTDGVSIDMYWHTVDFCDWSPYMGDYYYGISVPALTCRTAASYGKIVDMLRAKDALDGTPQPVWNFVENVSGSTANGADPVIATPQEVKGAAMNSLIHEARGLIWFNNVFGGPCSTGNAIRTAQFVANYPCAPQIKAMGEVNNLIKRLAPVLNTQSYNWVFGTKVETMLKARDGYAYIFAMTDGSVGERTFSLPAEIRGTSAEVLSENRNIPISSLSFSDDFATPSTYHIYKVKI